MKNRKPGNSMKPLKNTLKRALSATALIPLLLAAATLTATAAQRPITDFTSRQGAYCLEVDNDGNVDCAASGYHGSSCVLFVPPQPNVGGWIDPKTAVFTLVDYADLADSLLGGALGTTLDGSITEIPLPDGRAEVTVLLPRQVCLASPAWPIPTAGSLLTRSPPNTLSSNPLPANERRRPRSSSLLTDRVLTLSPCNFCNFATTQVSPAHRTGLPATAQTV